MGITPLRAVLLDVADTFKGSALHMRNAEVLTFKANVSRAAGDTRVAALHTANAERAFGAAVRDAHEGVTKLGRASSWEADVIAVRDAADTAIDSLRRADASVYTDGIGSLTYVSHHRGNTPLEYALRFDAQRDLLDTAGIAHARAVLPTP